MKRILTILCALAIVMAGSATALAAEAETGQSASYYPDTESYIYQLRSNFIRATDLECPLPESGVERQARTMFAHLAKAGALMILEE